MKQLHEFLQSKLGWYERWHSDPHGNAATWAIFLLAILLTFSSLLNIIEGNIAQYVDAEVQIGTVVRSNESVKRAETVTTDTTEIQTQLKSLNDSVYTYLLQYQNASSDNAPAIHESLSRFLSERQSLLRELASVDKTAAKRFAFGPKTVQMVPEDLKPLLTY